MGRGIIQIDPVKLNVTGTNVDASSVQVRINSLFLDFKKTRSVKLTADSGAHYNVFLVVRGLRGQSGKVDIQRNNTSLPGFPIECIIDNDYGIDHEPAVFDL